MQPLARPDPAGAAGAGGLRDLRARVRRRAAPYELQWGDEPSDDFARWAGADDLCAHGRLVAAEDRISNWSGVGELRRAFESVGRGLVPTLALAEIAVFRAHLRQVTWELVDASTGDVLVRDVPREGRRVRSGDGEAFDLGASAAGVFFVPAAVPAAGTIDRTLARLQPPFVPDDDPGLSSAAVFTSADVELTAATEGARYRDLASGATSTSRHVLGGRSGEARPGSFLRRVIVRERVTTADAFDAIL